MIRLAFVILCLLSSFASANDQLDRGKQLLAAGDKKAAWQILYPIAKNGSNPEAMLLLGQVLINSPEVSNNYAKAIPFLEGAAKSGEPLAEKLLEATKTRADFEANRAVNHARAAKLYEQNKHAWIAEQKRAGNGFVGPDGSIYDHKIEVYSDGTSAVPYEVSRVLAANHRSSARVLTEYYVVFPEDRLGSDDIFPDGYKPPEDGFTPDLDGARARALGITSLPSIIFYPHKGAHREVSLRDLSDIEKLGAGS